MMPFLKLWLIHDRFAPKEIPRGTKKPVVLKMPVERAGVQPTLVRGMPRRLDARIEEEKLTGHSLY